MKTVPAAPRFCFPATRRVRRSAQFGRVYSAGKRLHATDWTLIFAPNTAGAGRLGISIHRHLRGSVKRNRIKRIIRESYRLAPDIDKRLALIANHEDLPAYDLVVTVRPGFSLTSSNAFSQAMDFLLDKHMQRAPKNRTAPACRARLRKP